MEMPNQKKETILEQESCSPALLPLTLQRATLTDADRKNHEISKGVEMYTVTIGMHTFPFFSANVTLQRKFNVTDATVRYELTDAEPAYAEQALRIVVDVGGTQTVIDGEIFSVDSHSLRSQFLPEPEALEIERAMDPAYWQGRAEETRDGIVRYAERKNMITAGAATDLGYSPGSKKMEDRAFIDSNTFGVFDGISRPPGGEIAATISAETFHEIMNDKETQFPSPAWRLRKAFAVADERIRAYAKKAGNPRIAGTTAALAYIEILPDGNRKAYITSQGDSRAYLCRVDGAVYPITVDDAQSTSFALMPELRRQGAEGNNVVSRYIGCKARSSSYADTIPVREIVLHPGEFLVFTTDGIHDVLATHDKERGRLSGHIYTEVEKFMRNVFATQNVKDIQEYFTERHTPFNPLSKMMDPVSREISSTFWNQEATLADAISSALPSPMAQPPELINPQKIADTIMEITKEINTLRENNRDIDHRSKTDNRAVVVVM